MLGERSTAKNYSPVSLLSVVSKIFEKLVNNRIVDHLEKCGLFSDFQYGFRSSRSTADILTVLSDRIARAFNRSGDTQAVTLDIFKACDRVLHAGLLHKINLLCHVLFAGPKCHGTGTTGIVYLLSFCNYYQWLHLVHRLNTFYKDLQF